MSLVAGQPRADWDGIYRREAPALGRYLRRFTQDTDSAAELVQEAFVRAMRAENVPPGNGVTPWLYRIATNIALDHLRRRRRFSFIPLRETDSLASDDSHLDTRDQVRRALQRIPPDQAIVLVLRLHEGFPRQVIAELLGVSEAAVKSRLARGRLSFAEAYRRIDRKPT